MRTPSESELFSPTEKLDQYKSFFLVGIGGAGMSALARMLKHRGFEVCGTDSTASAVTKELSAEGIEVGIGHTGENLVGDQAVILTDAIDLSSSPEVARAQELKLSLFRRSQMLGWLLKDKRLIAVAGTHGKTTTTGMIGAALQAAGLDPLIVVGANVEQFHGPVVEGKGEWAVAEACEAYNSFLHLQPEIVVLTNLEHDHVDFFPTYDLLRQSALSFVKKMPPTGKLIYCDSDAGAKEIAELAGVQAIPYSSVDFQPGIPGTHNRMNAGAAMKVGEILGADPVALKHGLEEFHGAERRLQILYDSEITIVDDYAHHPTEIKASLQALRRPGHRLVVVFQPHLYSRTDGLFSEFAQALDEADFVVITDIYPAREAPIPGVSSARIAELLTKPHRYVPLRHVLVPEVLRLIEPGDVVVGMGAGNIGEFAPALVRATWLKREGVAGRRVVVLYGGDSAEREVSHHSGKAVASALLREGYEVRLVDASEKLFRADLKDLVTDRPDVAFLAVHGTNAEDGAIQGFLELLHIPYTGSGIQASAIAMDKHLAKKILVEAGIPVAKGQLINDEHEKLTVPLPVVVKPNAQGSTVGLSFVDKQDELAPAISKAIGYGSGVIVEEWLQGMEISVPVLGDRPLPAVEIVPRTGRYDFANKYVPGATEEIVPARISDELTKEVQDIALKAHKALGCQGATRTDMIIVDGNRPVVLEINTLPGLTPTSLLPNSARAAGIEFGELVDWIVQDALRRYAEKA